MKLLHTADWHVGKVLKGHARLDEHRAVLGEIVDVAAREAVDVVLVCGDLFESGAPAPEAQALVWLTLLALRGTGAEVLVVAGNHDSGAHLDAVRPLLAAAGCHVLGTPRRPDDGGVVECTARSDRALVRVALLPFVSQRGIVRSVELMAAEATAADHALAYADRVKRLVGALTAGFEAGAVNVLAGHAHVRGGLLGGGERDAQSIFDYWVDAASFPGHAHYVALGHLHRSQQIPGRCPIWYSGSPIRVDFGEQDEPASVLVVEATPSTPAKVRAVALRHARRLRTLVGTEAELVALAGSTGDDLLRLVVRGRARAGLADDLRERFPLALEVRVEAPERAAGAGSTARVAERRTPSQLFHEFLVDRDVEDERLERLFAELLDDAGTGAGTGGGG